jgi:FkbM family methyltransferase
MKKILRIILKMLGVVVIKHKNMKILSDELDIYRTLKNSLELVARVPVNQRETFQELFLKNFQDSRSQILQDIFVLAVLGSKENGYFVEAGASDGLDCSNTYLLEKKFGWNGLLIEPSKSSFESIRTNRSAGALNLALFSSTGKSLQFRETVSPGLSSLADFSSHDYMSEERVNQQLYQVETITLQDALDENRAPKTIDFLSLDTEGSEFEILKNFDFNTYKISVICCEHNYSKQRDSIYQLLTKNGYDRVLTEITGCDDWYIKTEIRDKCRDRGIIFE